MTYIHALKDAEIRIDQIKNPEALFNKSVDATENRYIL
jgi:hypothetical protein